jgi:superfamily I DNA/RNA helicase
LGLGWKSAQVSVEDAVAGATEPADLMAARLYEAYERHLRAYNAFDFDDLILKPVGLFRGDPEARERWQNRFRYLLVDEYQDTNDCQYELLRQLAGQPCDAPRRVAEYLGTMREHWRDLEGTDAEDSAEEVARGAERAADQPDYGREGS